MIRICQGQDNPLCLRHPGKWLAYALIWIKIIQLRTLFSLNQLTLMGCTKGARDGKPLHYGYITPPQGSL